jgi:hypothetical protein
VHNQAYRLSATKGNAVMNSGVARFGAPTQRSIAILMRTFLGFLSICLISQFLTISMRDKLFTDYLNHSIKIAATDLAAN